MLCLATRTLLVVSEAQGFQLGNRFKTLAMMGGGSVASEGFLMLRGAVPFVTFPAVFRITFSQAVHFSVSGYFGQQGGGGDGHTLAVSPHNGDHGNCGFQALGSV